MGAGGKPEYRFSKSKSRFGWIGVALCSGKPVTSENLRAVVISPKASDVRRLLAEALGTGTDNVLSSVRLTRMADRIADAVESGKGKRGLTRLPVEMESLAGSPFMRAVWNVVRAIPSGECRSYAEIAQSIGGGGSLPTRAVANAVARNPLALLIPCHRVILSSGEAGNYRWGPDIKRALLESEGVRLPYRKRGWLEDGTDTLTVC